MKKIWQIEFTDEALKELKKLDPEIQKRLNKYFTKNLVNMDNPREYATEMKYEFKSYWRFRVGDHRLVCKFTDHTIVISRIAHRRHVCDFKP